MKMMKPLAVAAALCVAPAIAQADGWDYASDICKDETANCMANLKRPMAASLFLGGGLTIERLNELNEHIEIDEDTMIPARMLVRVG